MQGGIRVSRDELEVLYEVMSDGTGTIEQQANALKDLKALGYDETTQSLDDFIEKQKELIILEASSDLIKNQLKKLVEDKAAMDTLSQQATDDYIAATKLVEQRQNLVDLYTGPDGTFVSALDSAKALKAEALAVVESLAEDRNKMTGFITEDSQKFKDLLKQIMGLRSIIDTGGNGSIVKDFKLSQSKMDASLVKSLREQELLLAESNAEKLRLNNEYAEEDLIATFESEVEKDAKKLEIFLKGKASPEQKAKAKRLHEENEKVRTAEYEESLTQIRYNAFIKENQLIEETKQAFDEQKLSTEIEREQNRLSVLEDALGNDPKSLAVLENQQRMIWEMEDANYELNLERRRAELFGIYDSENEVQQIIDEERTERDRVRAEEEVQLERDKADAKMAIQLEYLNYVQSLGNTLSILGKKNKALAIAGLAIEKGSAIARIIVKAAASNAQQTASDAAFVSAVNLKYAMVPGGQAASAIEIAANTAASAKARAKTNITAGLSIAKIAATSLTSSALGGGTSGGSDSSGGGGGGSTTFTPNFNVVGNSGTNQLAEGISNQVNEPTRAYVVYEDIAEAGNIVEESVESSGI